MINLAPIIQTTLDNTFAAGGIYTYWQQKSETSGEADEYFVFTLSGQQGEAFADNEPYVTRADATIRHYYNKAMLDTAAGRSTVQGRTEAVLNALKAVGLECLYGPFDAGDVDDIGYGITVFEVNYWRAGNGA